MRTQQFTWTDACCRIARLNPDDPKVPHSIDDAILFFHPEEREHLRLIAKQMMTEGGEFDIESRFINAQNKQLWLRIKGEALRDGSQITKLRGLMQDITASKQAANRLQAAEQFIHDTIDSLPSHLCVVDERGQILMVNRAWRQFAQENPPSPDNYFEGMNYLEVCDGASGAACEEATPFATGLRQVLDGEVDSFKLLYPCHSPTQQRWFHVNVSRFYENDKVRAVIMHENVTDRVLAEEAIRTLNRDFTTLLESTTDFIYFKDQNSRFRFCSQSMANAGGHQNWENLIGKYEQEVLPPELAKICSADEIDILNQCKPVLNKVQAYNDKEGQQHWLNTSKWPVNDRQNQVVGVFGISRDISDIKQVQMELERARDAAESANRAKSTFLANMSHELRTPLNGILGYTQILQQYEELGKSERESLEVIQRSGEYLLELINDVLDLAKIDAGRLELHIEAIHVKTFFQDIADMFRFRASRRDLIFDFSLKTPMPEYIHSDPIRLRQVIINILGNAMKFTQRGSVSLRVAYEKAELVIAVEDTGPGISAEDREEIFKPFSQSGDQRYKAQGTGLGLSITHKILHLMNAHLALESELGKGSCFTLHIPVDATTFAQTQESEDSKKAEKSEQDDNGASFDNMRISGYRCLNEKNALRILIVDDVADNREVLIRMLHPLGFEIQEASNGEACLSIAQNLPPDLVLMDLRMPKMDGHEATRQLHALEGLENIPIIAVSASAFQQDKEASHEAGCIDYIAKPVKRNTLLKLLQQYLPLEWVTYENEAVEEDDSITLEDSQRDEIADILRRGAITELINYLNELSLTSKYSEQASELFSLAKQIRIEDIRRRLKL